jgi:hypothetical protein
MQTSLSPNVCRVFLGCQPKKAVDELNLSKKITSCHPSSLPLPDHVDRFVALDRSPGRLKFSESRQHGLPAIQKVVREKLWGPSMSAEDFAQRLKEALAARFPRNVTLTRDGFIEALDTLSQPTRVPSQEYPRQLHNSNDEHINVSGPEEERALLAQGWSRQRPAASPDFPKYYVERQS